MEVESVVIIIKKDMEVKLVDLDIKVNELFHKEYYFNHMRENGIEFDILDFYNEGARM